MSEEQKKGMEILAFAANYGKEMPAALLGVWLELLEPYSRAQVHAAVKMVICEYDYKTMPPFAVLRRALDRVCGVIPVEARADILAASEWEGLLCAIGKYGSYNEPKLHPTTAYVLRSMGGWEAACQWETSKLEWRRKEFLAAWRMYDGMVDGMRSGAAALASNGFVAAKAVITSMAKGLEGGSANVSN